MAIPFVDVHPQTIALTLAVCSVPEAVTQAVVVILGDRAENLPMADFQYKSANFRPLTRCRAPRQARRRIQIVVNMAELLMNSATHAYPV